MAAAAHQEIVELLRQVTGEDQAWAAGITPATRVDTDLLVDSIELLALSKRMQEVYGPHADLAAHLARLDLPELIAYTVGDLVSLADGRT